MPVRVKHRTCGLLVGDCLGFDFLRRCVFVGIGYLFSRRYAVFSCKGFGKALFVGATVGCLQCCRSAPGSFGGREGAQNIIVAVSFLSADMQCMSLGRRLGKPRAAFKTLLYVIRRDIRRDITRCNGFPCCARLVLVLNPGGDGFPIDFSGDRYGFNQVLCTADLHRQQLIVGVGNRSADGGAGDSGGGKLHAFGALGTLGVLGVEALLYLRHVRQPADRGDFKSGRGGRRGSGGARG